MDKLDQWISNPLSIVQQCLESADQKDYGSSDWGVSARFQEAFRGRIETVLI